MTENRILRSIAVVFALATPVAAQDAGPFGLTWLVSTSDVEALGVSLAPLAGSDYGKAFTASGLPKALSDMETAILSFGYNDQLWRIVAFGKENDNDGYGSLAKARYADLATSLEKSYNVTGTYTRPALDSFYAKPENFAYALSKNEAFWYSTYTSPVADIELSIDAVGVNDTYWRLIYSHRAGEQTFLTAKGNAEADAL